MKRRLKTLLGWLTCHSGLYGRFFHDKALIVLFHRVDGRLKGDPISCIPSYFEAFCRFFPRYFKVVKLGELLSKLSRGDDVGRHLVITFDDGYLDNYLLAAPILRHLNLPACFFVATNLIESREIPWWDEKNGVVSEWMSWDHVRSLNAQGFEIGSHTMNHADLGVVVGEEAIAEIVGSKKRLKEELKRDVHFFSYPFGRVHQITETNREAVRKAGYACCLSAYGGAVAPGTDIFDVKRVPISNWFVSPYQFAFEAIFFKP